MSKKNNPTGGFVYSTNPDLPLDDYTWAPQPTLATAQQNLTIQKTNKHRGGKTVTLITGFKGTNEDLEKLSKLLKNKCGTGGSAKDGEIIIQGDMKTKVAEVLGKEGYKFKLSGG
jgi:translation initiation factor 1